MITNFANCHDLFPLFDKYAKNVKQKLWFNFVNENYLKHILVTTILNIKHWKSTHL